MVFHCYIHYRAPAVCRALCEAARTSALGASQVIGVDRGVARASVSPRKTEIRRGGVLGPCCADRSLLPRGKVGLPCPLSVPLGCGCPGGKQGERPGAQGAREDMAQWTVLHRGACDTPDGICTGLFQGGPTGLRGPRLKREVAGLTQRQCG